MKSENHDDSPRHVSIDQSTHPSSAQSPAPETGKLRKQRARSHAWALPLGPLLCVLEAEDAHVLSFIPESEPDQPPTSSSAEADLSQDAAILIRVFREIWRRIPLSDRIILLAHWQSYRPTYPLPVNRPRTSIPRPVLRIVEDKPIPVREVVCEDFGNDLIFGRALVRSKNDRLQRAIAEVLVQVLFIADGTHWDLNARYLDTPLDEWESQQGATASEERRERYVRQVEARFLRRFKQHRNGILRRWGLSSRKKVQGSAPE